MNLARKERIMCANFSSLFVNETQNDLPSSSDVKSCLFWNIVKNELLLNVSVVLILTLFIFSLVINIYLLLGLEHSEALSWNPRYILLKNLIVSDLMQTLTFAPSTLYCLISHTTLSFNFGCLSQFFTGALSITTSLLTVASMALERFIYTCHGIHYLVFMTKARIYCFVTLIWLLGVAGAGTSTVLVIIEKGKFDGIIAGLVCEPEVLQAQIKEQMYFDLFTKAFVGTLLFLCLLMFLFSYGRMYQEACQVQQPFQQDNIRARCTIAFYFAIFLLQLFPSMIKFITMCEEDMNDQLYMYMLILVPSCANPLAYGIRNVEVRQALKRLCGLK